jgi:hypothetical protein
LVKEGACLLLPPGLSDRGTSAAKGHAVYMFLRVVIVCCLAQAITQRVDAAAAALPTPHRGREPPSCAQLLDTACPGLLGDDCLICAGQHYAHLQVGCKNRTLIERACHTVQPTAALQWLEKLSDWIVSLGIQNGSLTETPTAKCSPCSTVGDRNHIFVNGNMARVLLATWRLQQRIGGGTANHTLLSAAMGWCDSLCDQQATIRTSHGNLGGYWGVGYPVLGPRGSIYFGDTGTAVTTLALAWHLSTNATQKARYLQTMQRFAAFVLEGSSNPPPGKNGTCDGFVAPPSAGQDAGAVGCGYYAHRPSTMPYTIATGTTGGAFFSELHTITQNETYRSVAQGAVRYLSSVVMRPSGEIPYILDGRNSSTVTWPVCCWPHGACNTPSHCC